MLLLKTDYRDREAKNSLIKTLQEVFPHSANDISIICIGSDKHLLDCFGPLTGTMIEAISPDIPLYGTLDKPLHALNLISGLKEIRESSKGKKLLAIDAAVGKWDELGYIHFRRGSLLPGKAYGRRLPSIGDYFVTGIVDGYSKRNTRKGNQSPGIAHVYHMARLLSEAISEWYMLED